MAAVSKNFKKRNAIMDYLMGTTAHPSAETIYSDLKQEIPDLSMGTVYRNLHLFKEQGKIISVANVNGVERFDANTKPHVHFICESCEEVLDIHELKTPRSICQEVQETTGGQVCGCHICFTGTCQHCLLKGESA